MTGRLPKARGGIPVEPGPVPLEEPSCFPTFLWSHRFRYEPDVTELSPDCVFICIPVPVQSDKQRLAFSDYETDVKRPEIKTVLLASVQA